MAHASSRRDFMPLAFGVHGEREAANPCDQGATPLRRSCLHCCPGQDTFHSDELVAVRHGVSGKQPERAGLVAKLVSKGSLQINVAFYVLVQHEAPPGQGWATCLSDRTSTLAYCAVVSMDRWRKTAPMATNGVPERNQVVAAECRSI